MLHSDTDKDANAADAADFSERELGPGHDWHALWVEFAHIDKWDLVRTSPLFHSRTSPRAERRAAERSGVERSEAERNGAQRSGALRSERVSERVAL